MFAACFRFAVPEGADWNAMRSLMKERAKQFHKLPGLRSKAFLLDAERREIGGNYVWETRESLRLPSFRAIPPGGAQARRAEGVAYL